MLAFECFWAVQMEALDSIYSWHKLQIRGNLKNIMLFSEQVAFRYKLSLLTENDALYKLPRLYLWKIF